MKSGDAPVQEVVPQQVNVGIVLDVLPQIGADNTVTMNIRPVVTSVARTATFTTARVIGPAVAGLLIDQVGIGQCFLLNAATFVPVTLEAPPIDPRFRLRRAGCFAREASPPSSASRPRPNPAAHLPTSSS